MDCNDTVYAPNSTSLGDDTQTKRVPKKEGSIFGYHIGCISGLTLYAVAIGREFLALAGVPVGPSGDASVSVDSNEERQGSPQPLTNLGLPACLIRRNANMAPPPSELIGTAGRRYLFKQLIQERPHPVASGWQRASIPAPSYSSSVN